MGKIMSNHRGEKDFRYHQRWGNSWWKGEVICLGEQGKEK